MTRATTTLRGLTVSHMALGAALLMAFGIAALIAFGCAVWIDIRDVSERWRVYELEAATKANALSELRGLVGLGGVIDRFHRYQLMGDVQHEMPLRESLRLARANMDVYRGVSATSSGEEAALVTVAACLDELEVRLPVIAAGYAAGRTPLDVIGETSIDMSAASAALASLNTELSRTSARLTEANVDGLDRLRRLMVIGGGVGSGLMLSVALLTVWIGRRRVVTPLERLVADSRRLAALELDRPFYWPRPDELGELGRTLDTTRQTLRVLLAENAEKNKRLSHQATHDHLTGLPNRAMLIQWLKERLGTDQDDPVALLFLDLDGFKTINDSLGHGVGDRLLIAVGDRLRQCLDGSGMVVRLGGDEFVVVIDEGGATAAAGCAARIERAFSRPFAVDGMDLGIATSVGIAIDDGHAGEPEDLLRDADIALYRAKENGRGRTEVFDVALRDAVQIRHRLQRDIEAATASGDLFVVYQPIIRLRDSSVIGFEALIRWRHPDLGLISPQQFIPIAEETGAILPLGRFVLDKAACDLAEFRAADTRFSDLTVNVNFSPRQMWDDVHVSDILTRLGRSDHAGIKIEVTESLAMANPDAAREILLQFRAQGVQLCIDDFGTGYSSLSYLGRFPFDILKMDKSFVAQLAEDSNESGRLVRGVVNLAHDLGLEVVAEGIETEAELRHLQRFGCDFGQGFLFSKPIPAADVPAFLEGRMSASPAVS